MFLSSILRVLTPGEFYVQKLKREEHAAKRPLGHPAVLAFLTLVCYVGAGGTFGYCMTTYWAMETVTTDLKVGI